MIGHMPWLSQESPKLYWKIAQKIGKMTHLTVKNWIFKKNQTSSIFYGTRFTHTVTSTLCNIGNLVWRCPHYPASHPCGHHVAQSWSEPWRSTGYLIIDRRITWWSHILNVHVFASCLLIARKQHCLQSSFDVHFIGKEFSFTTIWALQLSCEFMLYKWWSYDIQPSNVHFFELMIGFLCLNN